MTKIRSAYSSSTPIPLSVHGEAPDAPSRSAAIATRGGSSPRNLIALAIRFWNTAVSSPASPLDRRQVAVRRPRRPRRRARRRAVRAPPRRARPRSIRSCARVIRPTRENVEQVVDERLHPLRAVDGELDVLVRALVELAAVAALEHLGEARDLAQRLLQVVRGDVGELLELLVGALELLRPARSAPAPPRAARRPRRRSARASPRRRCRAMDLRGARRDERAREVPARPPAPRRPAGRAGG